MTYGKKMKEICTQLGVDVDSLPDKLYSTLLDAIAENAGSGGEITLDNINITENGTYTAETGHAYKKAVVDVPQEEPTLVEKSITENGTYTAADEAADGYSAVTVNVEPEQPTLVSKEITENGTYTAASEEADGFSQVVVNVEQGITPSGSISITENGTYDVTEKASAVVNVSATTPLYFSAFGAMYTENMVVPSTFTNVFTNQYNGATRLKTLVWNCKTVTGAAVFYGCSNLTTVTFADTCTGVLGSYFGDCNKITSVTIGNSITGLNGSFASCAALPFIDCKNVKSIAVNTFTNCARLKTVILRASTVCTLANVNAFSGNTPISSADGTYIYVPSSLVDSYKSATNWSTYADRIRAIEDYPEICG